MSDMDTSQSDLLEGSAIILPGQAVYAELPHTAVRNFTDSVFAKFANCPDADFVRGYGHRWEGGHDLIFDVARTFQDHGPVRAFNHAAHIILTDGPTNLNFA